MQATELIETMMLHGLEYFKIYLGVYRGVVTNVEDPEERGRIQVRVPAVGHSEAPTVWVKSAMQGAGKSRGQFWPPEVGDPVYVSFRQGNASKPENYWGGWYSYPSEKSAVPDSFAYTNSRPEKRGFITRMGHLLLFSDESGTEEVKLEWHKPSAADPAATDKSLSTLRTGGDIPKDGGKASLHFKPDGSVVLTDINGSTITMAGDDEKLELKDSLGNTAVFDSNGIAISDKNGNEAKMTSGGIEFLADAIKHGKGADSPAMRHKEWELWAKAHTHPTSVGPSGPPIAPPTPTIASQVNTVK
jgi:hypothetical protein